MYIIRRRTGGGCALAERHVPALEKPSSNESLWSPQSQAPCPLPLSVHSAVALFNHTMTTSLSPSPSTLQQQPAAVSRRQARYSELVLATSAHMWPVSRLACLCFVASPQTLGLIVGLNHRDRYSRVAKHTTTNVK